MKKKTKRNIIAIILFVGIVLVMNAFYWKITVEKRQNIIRELGQPITCSDLNMCYDFVPFDPEIVDTYARLFSLIDFNNVDKDIPIIEKRTIIPTITEETKIKIKNFLIEKKDTLTLLHRNFDNVQYKFPIDFRMGLEIPLPHLAKIRNCIQLISLETIYYANNGERDNAYRCIIDGLNFSDCLKNEPILVSYLVRVSCDSLMIESIRETINKCGLTNEQYTEIYNIIENHKNDKHLARAFIGERACYSFLLEGSLDVLLENDYHSSVLWYLSKLISLPQINYVKLLDVTEKQIKIAFSPVKERIKSLSSLEKEENIGNISCIYVFVKMLLPATSRVIVLDSRYIMNCNLLQTAIQIEQSYSENKVLPESALPVDLFGGGRIKYKINGDGYILYSVGEDGVDNNGIGENAEGTKYIEGTDIVFKVEK